MYARLKPDYTSPQSQWSEGGRPAGRFVLAADGDLGDDDGPVAPHAVRKPARIDVAAERPG